MVEHRPAETDTAVPDRPHLYPKHTKKLLHEDNIVIKVSDTNIHPNQTSLFPIKQYSKHYITDVFQVTIDILQKCHMLQNEYTNELQVQTEDRIA